jgi:hypothetical protein
MGKNISVLCIKGINYWIGVDLYEIKEVIEKTLENTEINEYIKENHIKNNNFYTKKSLFNEDEDVHDSLIVIESLPDHEEIILAVSGEINIIEVPLSKVLIIPEYIRKRQKNPYTWGIIKGQQKPIVLITFSHLSAGE